MSHFNSRMSKARTLSMNIIDTPSREHRKAFEVLSTAPDYFQRLANDLISGTITAEPTLVKQYFATHGQFKKYWKTTREFQGRKAVKLFREVDRLAHLVLGEVRHDQSR